MVQDFVHPQYVAMTCRATISQCNVDKHVAMHASKRNASAQAAHPADIKVHGFRAQRWHMTVDTGHRRGWSKASCPPNDKPWHKPLQDPVVTYVPMQKYGIEPPSQT